jgi:hypothetical protein
VSEQRGAVPCGYVKSGDKVTTFCPERRRLWKAYQEAPTGTIADGFLARIKAHDAAVPSTP